MEFQISDLEANSSVGMFHIAPTSPLIALKKQTIWSLFEYGLLVITAVTVETQGTLMCDQGNSSSYGA